MKNKNKTTKFPVARIKRIMQKDEEVGKVAQATPVVISKALELFLAMIIEEASRVTTERGSRRVEAYHLKHAVETVDMLDFLKEIVEGVPDPSAGGTIDLEAEAGEGGRKRRSGKGKKVAEADDAAPALRKRRKRGEAKEEGEGQPQGRRRSRKKEPEKDADPQDDPEEEDADMDEEDVGDEGVVAPRARRRGDDDDDDWEG